MDAPILFYDGECGLCDRSIRFFLRRDRDALFRFAPLKGDAARQLLPPTLTESLSTLVLLDEVGIHTHSDAMLRAVARLPAPWCWLRALGFLPRDLRDEIYSAIARERLRWFGTVLCPTFTAEQRRRMLGGDERRSPSPESVP